MAGAMEVERRICKAIERIGEASIIGIADRTNAIPFEDGITRKRRAFRNGVEGHRQRCRRAPCPAHDKGQRDYD